MLWDQIRGFSIKQAFAPMDLLAPFLEEEIDAFNDICIFKCDR